MLKRFGLSTLAVAAGLAVAAPGVSLARDSRGGGGRTGGQQSHSVVQQRSVQQRPEQRDVRGGFNARDNNRTVVRDRTVIRDRDDRGRSYRGGSSLNFGIGVYNPIVPVYTPPAAVYSPAPAATGYYDQYGVWHPYGYYDQFGIWHSYGY